MAPVITPIALPMPIGMGAVNAYLLGGRGDFVLVDTGPPGARRRLYAALDNLGCRPGNMRLVLLTHGDFDHTGNAADLRLGFGCPIGMHAEDEPMVESGDMFANRARPNAILRAIIPGLIGFGKAERFVPDVHLEDDSDLGEYGQDARVVAIPGHSKGSIGILTAEGDFICGDLYESTRHPSLNSLIDDLATALASDARVRSLQIKKVFPGHGAPFSPDRLAGPAI